MLDVVVLVARAGRMWKPRASNGSASYTRVVRTRGIPSYPRPEHLREGPGTLRRRRRPSARTTSRRLDKSHSRRVGAMNFWPSVPARPSDDAPARDAGSGRGGVRLARMQARRNVPCRCPGHFSHPSPITRGNGLLRCPERAARQTVRDSSAL